MFKNLVVDVVAVVEGIFGVAEEPKTVVRSIFPEEHTFNTDYYVIESRKRFHGQVWGVRAK